MTTRSTNPDSMAWSARRSVGADTNSPPQATAKTARRTRQWQGAAVWLLLIGSLVGLMPEAGAATVYRAINMNGPAISAGGISYEGGITAPNFSAGPWSFCDQNVTLDPATDAETATLVRCSGWGIPGANINMTSIPNGAYQVSLHNWEDNATQTFDLLINGQIAAADVVSGPEGSWKLLGPYPVSVTDGTLSVMTTGGHANLSSLIVKSDGPPPSNLAPMVTGPGAQISTVETAVAPLTIKASDADSGQTLAFSQTGLPAGLSLNAVSGVITGTPITVGSGPVRVTVTDDGPTPLSATTTFTWTIEAAGGQPGPYRAINLNGPAIATGGISYEAGASAPNFSGGPRAFCNQSVILSPATAPSVAALIRCSNWGRGSTGAQLSMTGIPNGAYQVSLHAWEDNFTQTFSLRINGRTVASNVASGAAGAWKLLGPFPVTITNGTLVIATSGGDANLSSVFVESSGGTPTNHAPTIADPGNQTSPLGSAITPLNISATDREPGQTITFTQTGLPAGLTLSPAGTITGTPTTGGVGSVSVTATDDGDPVRSAATTFTWTVTGGGGVPFDLTKVVDEFVAGGSWTRSVSADFLPNGHLLVLTQAGLVFEIDPVTGVQTQVLDITAKVFSSGEAGALDLLTDPAGAGYYIYYTVAGSDRLRISYFKLGSSAEQVIWNNPGLGYNTANPYHVGGSLNFGHDGKLYLSVGDRVEGRSDELTNVFGKVLRINADGTVPTDNPFYDGDGTNVDEIWAYGLRNPYRTNFDDATGLYWVGDVGGNVDTQAYEEVNIVEAGSRYGWPTCEGPLAQPKNGPSCPSGVTAPVFSYPHPVGGPNNFNRAIVGGEIYRGAAFPLAGRYLYADYPTSAFGWVQLGPDGRTAIANGPLAKLGGFPSWLGVGPDGDIYWLRVGFSGGGQLRRLSYTGMVNQPPTISGAAADPTSGPAPLTVQFSGAATDPEGTPLSYAWEFGDGGTSTAARPTHTYTTAGIYQARLQVTAGGDTVSSELIAITVGSSPVATISSPDDGTTFNAGDVITIAGAGIDLDDGPLTGASLSWNTLFQHNDHTHPGVTSSGNSVKFTIPVSGHDFTGNTRYRVELIATDNDGLSHTTAITFLPNKTNVNLSSNQARTGTVDNVTQNLPFTIDALIGFQHAVSVPAIECVNGKLWNFTNWSDGGSRTHTVTVTAGLNLVATYIDSGTSCATIGSLRYSVANTRTNPIDLSGANLQTATPIYAFLDTTTTDFTKVEFWLDDPAAAGVPRQTEAFWPYDFAGGATATGDLFNPGILAPGAHTITARATRPDTTTETLSATFTIGGIT